MTTATINGARLDWRRPALRYGVAVISVAAASTLHWLLARSFGPISPFLTLYPAVLLAATIAGCGPAVLASLLSTLVAFYFLSRTWESGIAAPNDLLALGLFACFNLFLCAFAERLRRTRQAEAISAAQQAELAERKRVADELHHQRELLRVTLNNIGDAVITSDIQGRITYLNAVAESLAGWPADAAIGQPVENVFRIVDETTRLPIEDVARVARGEKRIEALPDRVVLLARDDREVPIEDGTAPIRSESGDVSGAVLVFHDVVEKRNAQDELRSVALLSEQNPSPVVRVGSGNLLYANTAARELLERTGWKEGQPLPEQFTGAAAKARQTQTVREMEFTCKDHQTYSFVVVPILDKDYANLYGRDITERKRAEEATHAAQLVAERHAADIAALMDAVPAAVFVAHDVDCHHISGSRITHEMLGLPAETNLSKSAPAGERPASFRIMKDGQEIPAYHLPVQRAAHGAEIRDYELDLVFDDGTVKTLLGDAVPLLDESGRPRGAIGAFLDITARKHSEDVLHKSQARSRFLAGLLEQSEQPFATGYPDGRIGQFNGAFARLTGYTARELQAVDWLRTLTPPEWREREAARLEQLRSSGEPVRYEKEYIRKDGSRVPIELLVHMVCDEKGQLLHYYAFITDQTERRRAEEQLRDLNQRLTYHMDYSPLAVIEFGPDKRLIRWSGQAERVFGWKAEEVLGKAVEDFGFVYADDLSLVGGVFVELCSGTNLRRFSANRNYRKDGTVIYCEWYNSSLLDDSGKLRSILSLALDVTERRRAEEALRNSERLYRAIGETIDYGIWVCAPDGRNIYASESFLKLVGMTQEQCSDFGWGDALHPDDAERSIVAWKECVRTGGTWDIEHRYKGADGQYHAILARGVPVRDEQGKIVCWAGINLDISRLRG